MKIFCRKQPERGTTLVEVVIATAVLAISMSGIMAAIWSGFFIMGRVRENQRATQIILEKVETIRLYNWTQVTTPGFIPTTFTNTYDPQSLQGAQGITYRGTFSITNFPHSSASYSANMRQVIVKLDWNSESNKPRSRSFVTYIAKDGIQNYVY
jgi:type II secretory pathway pseudopilin PulG